MSWFGGWLSCKGNDGGGDRLRIWIGKFDVVGTSIRYHLLV